APGHGRRLHRPVLLDPDAGGAQLLDGHHGDGVPLDLVGLVARSEVRALSPGSAAQPVADDPAGHYLGTSLSAVTMRLTRTMMRQVLRQDSIRTARAKGLSESLVVARHALRNALIPVVTLIGLQAPLLIGGAVIMEQIFVIPGMGLLLLDAVNQRDYPII